MLTYQTLPGVLAILSTVVAYGLIEQSQSVLQDEAHELFPDYIRRNLGPNSPYFPTGTYASGPKDCILSQVNLLYRHGARYPTAGAGSRLNSTVARLKSASTYISSEMEFLRTYEYSLRTDDLLPYGAHEMLKAGGEVFDRYKSLLNGSSIPPFIRVSQSPRVIDSSGNWTLALVTAAGELMIAPESVIIPESEQSNNTLADHNCPAFDGSISTVAQMAYLLQFAPLITARLNRNAPGAYLTDEDIPNIFALCAFDTLASQRSSPFCDWFSVEEYAAFEYYSDLSKFYGTGYGNPLGRVQGVGYVNELIARLTATPVSNVININRTLDADPNTFPLDRRLYADFSHDNQMIAIYAALNLHKPIDGLPLPTVPAHLPNSNDSRWVASELTPFGARLAIEKYTCQVEPSEMSREGLSLDSNVVEWIRILNNDAVQEIDGCHGASGRPGGLCELKAFLKTVEYARGGAEEDWAKCLAS